MAIGDPYLAGNIDDWPEIDEPPDRPDPLAEPEGYGVKPGDCASKSEVLDVCASMTPGPAGMAHCPREVAEIWTVGCTVGEHVGRIGLCVRHAAEDLYAFRHMKFECGSPGHVGRRPPARLIGRAGVSGADLPVPSPESADAEVQAAIEQVWLP